MVAIQTNLSFDVVTKISTVFEILLIYTRQSKNFFQRCRQFPGANTAILCANSVKIDIHEIAKILQVEIKLSFKEVPLHALIT